MKILVTKEELGEIYKLGVRHGKQLAQLRRTHDKRNGRSKKVN